jgi:1-acyl-sn-glycerol-3-phosphate acyltransferase
MKLLIHLLLPLRLFFIAVFTFVLGLVFIASVLTVGKKASYKYTRIPYIWGSLFCFLTGAKVKVFGKENIPKDKGVVYLFSHASFLDIPLLFAALKSFYNFAAKTYVFKIPVIGQIGRVMGSIEIKKDLNDSIKEYKRAEALIKEGESFMIAPEGKRSDSESIEPFKSGPFIFALNAKSDLVPVVIYGASKIWSNKESVPNLKIFGGSVYISVLPLVEVKHFNDDNRKVKAEEIRQDMILELEKLKKIALD